MVDNRDIDIIELINQQWELNLLSIKIPLSFRTKADFNSKTAFIKIGLNLRYISAYTPGDSGDYYHLTIKNNNDFINQLIEIPSPKTRQHVIDSIALLNAEYQRNNLDINHKLGKENLEEQDRRKKLQIAYTSEDYQRQIAQQQRQQQYDWAKIGLGIGGILLGAVLAPFTGGVSLAGAVGGAAALGTAVVGGMSSSAARSDSIENLNIQAARHQQEALKQANYDALQQNLKLDADYSYNTSLAKTHLMSLMNNWESPTGLNANIHHGWCYKNKITLTHLTLRTTKNKFNKNLCRKILRSYGVNTKLYDFTIDNQQFLQDNIYVFSNVDVIQGITDPLHYEILKRRLLNGIKIMDIDTFTAEGIKRITPLNVPSKEGIKKIRYLKFEEGKFVSKEKVFRYEDFDL